jgi:hypothetical protein
MDKIIYLDKFNHNFYIRKKNIQFHRVNRKLKN